MTDYPLAITPLLFISMTNKALVRVNIEIQKAQFFAGFIFDRYLTDPIFSDNALSRLREPPPCTAKASKATIKTKAYS